MGEFSLKIPDIGGVTDASVADIYIKVGDKISKDANLIMLETDKATMDVPSTHDGVIKSITIKRLDKLKEGDEICVIEISQNSEAVKNTSTQNNATSASKTESKEEQVVPTSNKVNNNTKSDDSNYEYDVVVIGAGPGGYTAAFRSCDLNQKTLLVEKYDTLGGVCLNVGCIPSKALLHVANVINEAKEIEKHGVVFGAPKLNLDKIREFKKSVVTKLTGGLSALAKQRKLTIEKGEASFIDNHTIEIKGSISKKVTFKNIIIASGSKNIKLPNIPYDDPRILDSTTALELSEIPKTMLIVGGGIIGLEMSEVYSTLGAQVTVVELSDGLIPPADRDVVKVLENRIKNHLTSILLKTKCEKIEAREDALYVTFSGENAPKEVCKFDKILISTGRAPQSKTLKLENAKVKTNERGFIVVDKTMATNVDNIFAIGDVVSNPMLAHKATYEAKIAAHNASIKKGDAKCYFDAKVIPSVAYTDPEIAWVGLTEKDAKAQNIDIEVAKFPWAASGRALGSMHENGFTKVIACKKTHVVLGGAIAGFNAGELIAEIGLAIEMGATIEDIALTIHAHPTLSESVALSCEMIEGTITDLYVPRKK